MCAETDTEMQTEHETMATDLVAKAKTEAGGDSASPSEVWSVLHKEILTPSTPFEVHQLCYQQVYESVADVKPCWLPTAESLKQTNISKVMSKKGMTSYQELFDWSTNLATRNEFWAESMEYVNIAWDTKPSTTFEGDTAHVSYFPGGKLNIADSCFNKRSGSDPAIVYAIESDPTNIQSVTFGDLKVQSNQVAHAIVNKLGCSKGDAIAVCMPMTPESVAIYLGIVKAGCAVISIADSFSAAEIATRCRLGKAKAIFTQDVIYRGEKFLPLFTRVLEADKIVKESNGTNDSIKIVALPGMLHAGPYKKGADNITSLHESVQAVLRADLDCSWSEFLSSASGTTEFSSVICDSMDTCNILFSSGTTGEPKAIVWSHSTPIKCAVDGYYHQDIQVGETVAWPTNIGWMMGPWLLFQLINGATIGLFNGMPSTSKFCQFVSEAKISMVGVIPSIVKAWQARGAMDNVDWSCVRRFSSTGEASDPINYLWLMSRVPGYAPVMEYCGGTEIGGSFLSSTMVHPNVPSMFATPVIGAQFYLLDATKEGSPVMPESSYVPANENITISGELAIVPPFVGLSTKLLNRDHFDTYYKDMPSGPNREVLRRHGDEIQMVRNTDSGTNTSTPYFRALGRCDDTMNIGGIKVGSVEIERVCNLVDKIQETAAIAVSSTGGGPSKLVIYVVLTDKSTNVTDDLKAELKLAMRNSIKAKLNPLFGISDIVIADTLPRTASNKVMRRLLRDEYMKKV